MYVYTRILYVHGITFYCSLHQSEFKYFEYTHTSIFVIIRKISCFNRTNYIMRKESLIVKNFFTLKDINIDLAKFNIFIGEQASGKSLLIKLVYFFRNHLRLPIHGFQDSQEQINEYLINQFKQIFKLDTNDLKCDFKIEYHFDNFVVFIDGFKQINIKFSDNLVSFYEKYRSELLKIHKQMLNQDDRLTNLFDLQYKIMKSDVNDILRKSALGVDQYSCFIPAGRTCFVSVFRNIFNINLFNTIGSGDEVISLDQLLLWFGKVYQDSIDKYGKYGMLSNHLQDLSDIKVQEYLEWFDKKAAQILKGGYVHDNLGGFISQECGDVRPWYSSSGQQEFLPIYLVLRSYFMGHFQGDYLYIEEPEAHLYPTAQKDITELLVYITNIIQSSGLCITTHSPYILTVFNNLILANNLKEKQKIFDEKLLVPFEDVRAYFIANGTAHDLRDYENHFITADDLDGVSESTASDFEQLLDLKYE